MKSKELIFLERKIQRREWTIENRITNASAALFSAKKKRRGMVKKAMSTPSDTLPFKDHSATDRKGVPLDFAGPLRHFLQHRYLLEVCSLLVLHTGDPSLAEFSFHFTLFVLIAPSSTSCLVFTAWSTAIRPRLREIICHNDSLTLMFPRTFAAARSDYSNSLKSCPHTENREPIWRFDHITITRAIMSLLSRDTINAPSFSRLISIFIQ